MVFLYFTIFLLLLFSCEEINCPELESFYFKFSDGTLEPSFDLNTSSYSLFVPCSFTSVYIIFPVGYSIFIDDLLITNSNYLIEFNEYRKIKITVYSCSFSSNFFVEIIELVEECY